MLKFIIPLFLFIVMAIFLAVGLQRNPGEIPSPLINKPAPTFSAPQLDLPTHQVTPSDFLGKVWVLNVWASWCTSCREEHPVLNQLVGLSPVTLVGLNYKDKTEDAQAWLGQSGNPYALSIADQNGRIGIEWGVYGVPETFVIDKKGIVRLKHIGPLTIQSVQQTLLPMITQLDAEPL